jgi:hypothetical protein
MESLTGIGLNLGAICLLLGGHAADTTWEVVSYLIVRHTVRSPFNLYFVFGSITTIIS